MILLLVSLGALRLDVSSLPVLRYFVYYEYIHKVAKHLADGDNLLGLPVALLATLIFPEGPSSPWLPQGTPPPP